MYFAMVRLPSFSPTVAHAVFTEWVSASVSVMRPKLSPPKLRSGTPEIGFRLRPLTSEFGVNSPLSIAAIAVTTLNVEPGV